MPDLRSGNWLDWRVFEAVSRNNLIYNQCWEDPAVDRQALALTPADRVLVITSAGCNALDYALLGARVLAVDQNPRQNHLLELKRAGIRALDFESFFALFGEGGSGRAREIYTALRPALPEPARGFWDWEIRLFEPERARGQSFYYGGTSGLVALVVQWYVEHVAKVWGVVERILAAETIEDQVGIYTSELRHRLFGANLLRLLGSPSVLALLGVPAPQRRMVHAASGGFAGFIYGCLDHVMSVSLLRQNYFYSVYLNGRYTRDSCPEYLKEANFARLKAGLVDRIETFTGTVTECLARQEEPVTAFVLLDHMDWMVPQPRLLEEEWAGIFAIAAPGARVIFRSGGPDARFLPTSILRRLAFARERAAALHRQDRVGTYGSFHIASFANV
ncbi:MAG TPA: BtaA family protein [Vicinamibacteria bacterium]|jgi:S-adenosylmethionine-diacylglycerol 3-amino-3-carboxypropyl transferase|nr:BtaA family protein [Vicinamibacteria bacterium]